MLVLNGARLLRVSSSTNLSPATDDHPGNRRQSSYRDGRTVMKQGGDEICHQTRENNDTAIRKYDNNRYTSKEMGDGRKKF
ncbi:hypothetical protein AVEN_193244-1, partial [Araneus ventricosus]